MRLCGDGDIVQDPCMTERTENGLLIFVEKATRTFEV